MVRILLNIAVLFNAVMINKPGGMRLLKRRLDFFLRENVERALAFFMWMRRVQHTVSILGAIERPFRARHVAQHIVQRFPGNLGKMRLACELKRFQVGNY